MRSLNGGPGPRLGDRLIALGPNASDTKRSCVPISPSRFQVRGRVRGLGSDPAERYSAERAYRPTGSRLLSTKGVKHEERIQGALDTNLPLALEKIAYDVDYEHATAHRTALYDGGDSALQSPKLGIVTFAD